MRRISLRTGLVVLTIFCICIAAYSNAARKQRQAVRHLSQLGAEIIYAHDTDVGGTGEVSAPRWLVGILGVDYFSTVQSLYVSNCKNSDLEFIADLHGLRSLSVLDQEVSDIRPLSKLKKLEYLRLWNSKIRSLDAIKDLPKFRHLSLNNNDLLSSLSPLVESSRRSFTTLFLWGEFENDFETLVELEGLEKLRLYNRSCKVDLRQLGRIANLESLWIENMPLDDLEWVPELKRLERITIRKIPLDDLTPLSRASSLSRVEIGRRGTIANAKVLELQKLMPNCKISHAW